MWFPFTNFCANANWMTAVMKAADLVRWFQLLCFDGPWVNTRPKALRCGIFYPPGHLIHRSRPRIVRIIDGWPGTDALLGVLPAPGTHRLNAVDDPSTRHQADDARLECARWSSFDRHRGPNAGVSGHRRPKSPASVFNRVAKCRQP